MRYIMYMIGYIKFMCAFIHSDNYFLFLGKVSLSDNYYGAIEPTFCSYHFDVIFFIFLIERLFCNFFLFKFISSVL